MEADEAPRLTGAPGATRQNKTPEAGAPGVPHAVPAAHIPFDPIYGSEPYAPPAA
jgi:hypothetical protein